MTAFSPDYIELSSRQFDVLLCAANDMDLDATADALGIASSTVARHRMDIKRNLNVQTMNGAVAKALAYGLIAASWEE